MFRPQVNTWGPVMPWILSLFLEFNFDFGSFFLFTKSIFGPQVNTLGPVTMVPAAAANVFLISLSF